MSKIDGMKEGEEVVLSSNLIIVKQEGYLYEIISDGKVEIYREPISDEVQEKIALTRDLLGKNIGGYEISEVNTCNFIFCQTGKLDHDTQIHIYINIEEFMVFVDLNGRNGNLFRQKRVKTKNEYTD